MKKTNPLAIAVTLFIQNVNALHPFMGTGFGGEIRSTDCINRLVRKIRIYRDTLVNKYFLNKDRRVLPKIEIKD